MKLFFSDHVADRDVSADEPLEVDFSEVLKEFDALTDEDGCFLGIIDDKEQTLQFIYTSDGNLSIDLPLPAREGSLHKDAASFEECWKILLAAKNGVRVEEIPGLVFQAW